MSANNYEQEYGGLLLHSVWPNAQPFEIARDRFRILLARAHRTGVVEAKDEGATPPLREGLVVKRRARIAEMDKARRRECEADGRMIGGPHAGRTHTRSRKALVIG